jgi:hypothetical protein
MTKLTLTFAFLAVIGISGRADISPMNETPRERDARYEAHQTAYETRVKDAKDKADAESKLETERMKVQETELADAEKARARRAADEKSRRMLELGSGVAILGVIAAAGVYKAKR